MQPSPESSLSIVKCESDIPFKQGSSEEEKRVVPPHELFTAALVVRALAWDTTNSDLWNPPCFLNEAARNFISLVAKSARPVYTASGFLEELPQLCQRLDSGQAIYYTIAAVSLTLLGPQQFPDYSEQVSRIVYGKALAGLRALLSSSQSHSNDALMCTLLLSILESSPAVQSDAYTTHHCSAIPLLLKHRGKAQLEDPLSRRIFFTLQHQLVRTPGIPLKVVFR